VKAIIACLVSMGLAGCDCGRPTATNLPPALVGQSPAPAKPSPKPSSEIFTFQFSNIRSSPDADPPRPGQVYVTIIKDDPVAGRVEWRKIQYEGDRLGWTKDGEKLTSIYRVFGKNGKLLRVDFDTKAVLERVTADKLIICESRHCPILERPLLRCPGPTVVKSSYKVNEVVIRLDSGKILTNSQLAGLGRAADTLCPSHGGRDEPLKWSEEQMKAIRSQEAETLYWQSEGDWLSKNPKVRARARDAYRKLLKEFPSEAVVTKYLERIKARAEADLED
jgi:hypothetical protein